MALLKICPTTGYVQATCPHCKKPKNLEKTGQLVTKPVVDRAVIEQVQQEVPTKLIPIPVEIERSSTIPVLTLPARRSGQMHTINWTSAGQYLEIVKKDTNIRRIILSASGGGTYMGTETQMKSPQGIDGFLMPSGFPVVFEGVDTDLWAGNVFGTGNSLTYRVEYLT